MKILRALASAVAGASVLAACSHDVPSSAAGAFGTAAHRFRCDDGSTLVVAYPTSDTATLQLRGATHALRIARSGSGARYTGSGLQWWSKGNAGTLSRLGPDGHGAQQLAQCQLQ
ncbi:Membrane-bound inhibitor of C-type lysozyme [Oryzisolibacter propanilivorax]|uniref:Membrane-bound inhibitor of C-type lysozyme n=1 Tax=Oryzisolibacter propanilivorax TaxID=1527607 RepID=A0A1G9THD9_9BURK|nr:MliC family protein [Oryzisolibacter propanilivorax]SDM46555.1 Membrane-bound inhibitor of C-type lysozyme [Oryzisolibacter propanilivorax]